MRILQNQQTLLFHNLLHPPLRHSFQINTLIKIRWVLNHKLFNLKFSSHLRYIQNLYSCKVFFFLSGSDDQYIILWMVNNQKQWQRQESHTDRVNCVILNNKEDFTYLVVMIKQLSFGLRKLIMGMQLDNIRSYRKCSMFIFESIIQQADIMLIKVGKQSKKISVQRDGYCLCFITDQMFKFQQKTINIMYIYQLNTTSQQFMIIELEVNIDSGKRYTGLILKKFIKEKQILLNNNGLIINLIRLYSNGQFKTDKYCALFVIQSHMIVIVRRQRQENIEKLMCINQISQVECLL
ncbi:unnamed protein product [Paramecium octaurelia]|uniref:Uncharacterized protein n=1 Tax=Paramecium octaurelia TaxID=43137 RepID=A0A8S1T2C6_PAROT|nr:unnamed protein product [Paramecium octaurelia]